jgi:hypothetical protein
MSDVIVFPGPRPGAPLEPTPADAPADRPRTAYAMARDLQATGALFTAWPPRRLPLAAMFSSTPERSTTP